MNKMSLIILSVMLSLPISAWAVENNLMEDLNAPAINTIDEDIDDVSNDSVNYKTPINKKKIVKKFLVAMLAVGGSSLLIYLGLSAYNKVRENFLANSTQDDVACLEAPENYEEAVRTFLDKTNW